MVEVVRTLVFGAMLLLGAYLERSPVRATINTAFVERNNGTDRHQDARKRRKACGSPPWTSRSTTRRRISSG
ncbi:MAG: hypothetical protein ACM35G_10425, partial [Planctomycetaceae bacterium]